MRVVYMSENHHEVEDTMMLNEVLYTLKRAEKYTEVFVKLSHQKAKFQRIRFEALREAGFTSKQALEIVASEKTPFDN